MGAATFEVRAQGKTVSEAFSAVTEEARHEYGHGGYTGTIAEKSSYVLFELPFGKTVAEFLDACQMAEWDEAADKTVLPDWLPESVFNAYDDKWGPCVAIKVADNEWVFCGWASS